MRKLITVVAILALFASFAMAQGAGTTQADTNYTDGAAATATLEVGLSVAKYAEVTWNNPSQAWIDTYGDTGTNYPMTLEERTIELQGPAAGWVAKANQIEVPIRLRSNCDVVLALGEGMTQAMIDAGVPTDANWYGADTQPSGPVYGTALALLDPTRSHYGNTGPGWGNEIIGGTAQSEGGAIMRSGNPFGVVGLWGEQTFTYGGDIRNLGAALDYTGDFETVVLMGGNTIDNTCDDGAGGTWTWTDLTSDTTFNNGTWYAQISVIN